MFLGKSDEPAISKFGEETKTQIQPMRVKKKQKQQQQAFPSSLESIAASSLLLLATTPKPPSASFSTSPPQSKPCLNVISRQDGSHCSSEPSESIDSKSCTSSLTSSVSSERIRVITVAARLREKLQVSRRARSKVSMISKPSPGWNDSTSSGTTSTKLNSITTSSSRELTVTGTGSSPKTNNKLEAAYGRNTIRSPHIFRRAEAILKLLSEGGASETKIRKELGDSPDTSKALRILLKMEEVKRSGTGGRGHPFIYTIAQRELYISDD